MAEIIEMPKLSDTMTVGTLVKWIVKEGGKIASGDMICEVETDKATMEVEVFSDGVILKHYVAEGSQIPVGAPMCAVGQEGEEAPEVEMPKADAANDKEDQKDKDEAADSGDDDGDDDDDDKAAAADDKDSAGSVADKDTEKDDKDDADGEREEKDKDGGKGERDDDAAAQTGKRRIKASPLARRIAADKGIDLSAIKGSGPGGRIVKVDVLNAPATPAAKSAPADEGGAAKAVAPAAATGIPLGESSERPVSNMRTAIARRLVESKTRIPHFYLEIEVDSAPLSAMRQELNAQLADLPPEQGGMKFTVNDLILKAAAEALRRVPAVNASWDETVIRQHGSVHLAFGVAVDDGLVTPVIRSAEAKTLRTISAEAKALIAKARSKKLKPDEMSGSTFTVTNLGMFGISGFFGIINPPNAAILSVGAGIRKPVVNAAGEIVVGERMLIGLSGDHRVIDGASGAQYLAALKAILEVPSTMLA